MEDQCAVMPGEGNLSQSPNRQDPIANEIVKLFSGDVITEAPPIPQFGMGFSLMNPFTGYQHAMQNNLYAMNMMYQACANPAKRRRRTNYRDPENASKLTAAVAYLIERRKSNKYQDLKSVATHYGLPYNTLRDNYLK